MNPIEATQKALDYLNKSMDCEASVWLDVALRLLYDEAQVVAQEIAKLVEEQEAGEVSYCRTCLNERRYAVHALGGARV